jgi:hypothetical protein
MEIFSKMSGYMRTATIRYETSGSGFTRPFKLGMRHFKLATCNGSQETLVHLAKERVIHRTSEGEDTYNPLTKRARVKHFVVGTLETAGYITLIIPFITVIADSILTPRLWYSKGGIKLRVHMEEGGSWESFNKDELRRNPFHANAAKDPFYQDASWVS